MKILNFGSCNVDYVYTVDHVVNPGETENSDSLSIFPGGKGLNQSIALAKAGAEVYHAGCIGEGGEFLAEMLEDAGVNISFLKTVKGKNGHAIIQVTKDGENSIFLYPGSNAMITREQVDDVLGHFQKGDILLLQNEINNLDYIIRQGKKMGMQVFLTPAPYNENITKLDLTMISCLVLNAVEAKDLSGCDDPEDALAYFKAAYPDLKIMMTLGKEGCMYQDKDGQIQHPIFKVKAVDTTAAGDTFAGYFVTGLSQGKEIKEVLKLASCASAISVSRNGAAPSIPNMAEVLEQVKFLPLNDYVSKSKRVREKTEKYISENIENASLEEFSEVLGYSVTYTGNLIKKTTGSTFKKLLQDKRLSIAARLLLESDLPISEIIKKVGYENESFFRKIFKEKYGNNPLVFRKINGK